MMSDEEKAQQLFLEARNDVNRRDLAGAERKLLTSSRLAPERAAIMTNLAIVMSYQNRFEETRAFALRATGLDPRDAEAWRLLGAALIGLGRFGEALEPFERAVVLAPKDARAQVGRGEALALSSRFAEAAEAYEAALRIDPWSRYVRGELVLARLNICDWRDLDDQVRQIRAGLQASMPVLRPFAMLMLPIGARWQLRCAQMFAAVEFPPSRPPLWSGQRYAHDRIRVAYLSPDFREHPVSRLTVGMFEHHDRQRFEVVGVALTGSDGSKTRARVAAAFERFVEVEGRSDDEIAGLLRSMEIDIAVDLAGITLGARPQVFARRPAPLQVNYLGFPATMGSACIDYIIADPFLVPVANQGFYAERVAYVPNVYRLDDAGQPIGAPPSRSDAGLPESGFVFCAFNASNKILPDVFDVWMRLLGEIDGSVLWLRSGNGTAAGNLRKEAERRGVAGERLVFAPGVSREQHLARHALAGLFLDTVPWNAHSTAVDALATGLPVITCPGETYASRVAASLVIAAGVPELATASLAEYEALALRLARDASLLAAFRDRLRAGIAGSPSSDIGRYTRHIEAAYVAMWQRAQRGEPPASFSVPVSSG